MPNLDKDDMEPDDDKDLVIDPDLFGDPELVLILAGLVPEPEAELLRLEAEQFRGAPTPLQNAPGTLAPGAQYEETEGNAGRTQDDNVGRTQENTGLEENADPEENTGLEENADPEENADVEDRPYGLDEQTIIKILEDTYLAQPRNWPLSDRDLPSFRVFALRIINTVNKELPRTPILYRFGGQLAQIESDAEGYPVITLMEKVRMRYLLSYLFSFHKIRRDDTDRITHITDMAPSWCCEDILIAPNPDLPVLEGVTAAPAFAKGVPLQTERGYCPASHLFYEPPTGVYIPEVPIDPDPDQIAWARQYIVQEMLADFPFTEPGDLAGAVALFLLPFVRGLIDGPTPLHLIEKPTPGTGATLLVDVLTMVASGRPPAGITAPTSDEEMDKRLLAQFMSGAQAILFDNLRHKLDSSSLAMALTASKYGGRLLGKSTILEPKIRCSWIATANNPRLSNELTRRSIRIRLDAKVEEPWRRNPAVFRHPNLLGWVGENRGSLICAALILGAAFRASGSRPAPDNPTLGMFESWSKTMGGILHVAGIPGFLTNLDALYESANEETATLRAFISAWWHVHGSAEKQVADLFGLAESTEPPLELGDKGERSQKSRLGKIIAAQRDRQFKITLDEALAIQWGRPQLDVRVTSAKTARNAQVWKLVPVL